MKDKPVIKPIVLGKIGSCYGIRGWLRIFSFTEKIENIFEYQPWFVKKKFHWEELKLEKWCHHNDNIIIKLESINNRNAASFLINYKIIVDSSQLPALEEGNYYWKDLIGCHVITTTGYDLGKVVNMITTGSNDVLLIKANLKDIFGFKERLIPFLHNQIIKEVDLLNQLIKVNWDPILGLPG